MEPSAALIQSALELFGQGDAVARFVGHSETWVYQVSLSSSPDISYALRIHDQEDTPRRDEIRSELFWLQALAAVPGVVAPVPLPTGSGALLGQIEDRLCALSTWIPGRFVQDEAGPAHFRRIGALLADLQRHARLLERPDWFTLPRLTLDQMGVGEPGTPGRCVELLSAAQLQVLVGALEGPRILPRVRALWEAPEAFGVVHGDLHLGNLLFDEQDRPQPIDFGDCCWSSYLRDLCIPMSSWDVRVGWSRPEQAKGLEDALLEGYRSRAGWYKVDRDDFLAFLAWARARRLVGLCARSEGVLSDDDRARVDYLIQRLEPFAVWS